MRERNIDAHIFKANIRHEGCRKKVPVLTLNLCISHPQLTAA